MITVHSHSIWGLTGKSTSVSTKRKKSDWGSDFFCGSMEKPLKKDPVTDIIKQERGEIMIRILVVDDHELIVESMKAILSTQDDMQIVAGANSGDEALQLTRDFLPDLIITDVYMPSGDGMMLTKAVKTEFPQIKILALTIFDDDKTVRAMLEAGVDGIISKDLRKDNLILSIKNTMSGMSVLDAKVYTKFKEIYQSPAYKDQQIMNKFDLSSSELEIIRSVSQGLSNATIAEKLYISESTVKHRLAVLMDKFAVQDRVQLAVSAAKNGIL